ncbi:DUF4105 domain-containing protein [Bordetella petrii]|uniref:Lnb N-terminal periplasmic domain-containing protein n=1 Tax=Bordetella petrii TaxID=94624 RepID=UPI001E2C3720|nr:DUF4105 domain-containing protein [Bordetella petrii]MCD0503053.1 DUF4105 domain-containing protein [Bordetella petrii]
MIGAASFVLVVLAATLWGSMALWVQRPLGVPFTYLLIVIWVLLALAACVLAGTGHWRGALWFLAPAALMAAWWLTMQPAQHRDWEPSVARLLQGSVDGDTATLHNVRNFHWRGPQDFDERWETRQYSLAAIRSVDMVLSYWSRTAIAHTLVSFGFADGDYLVFSVEIRRKRNDKFSELGGFFRQYELSIVAADEQDILRVRTNIRKEDGYLYRVNMAPDDMRALFVEYINQANKLAETPRFYNTLTANCTTLVYRMVNRIVTGLPLDYRLLASGYLPEYLYELGALRGAANMAEYREKGRYTDRARDEASGLEFSRRIRLGVPGVAAETLARGMPLAAPAAPPDAPATETSRTPAP